MYLAARRAALCFWTYNRKASRLAMGCNEHPRHARVSSVSRQLRPGEDLGPYSIVKKLGGGGNADVYEATNETHGTVALKVLRSRSRTSEPYRRFRQEVAEHYELSRRAVPGVLPLLDFDVPENPDDEHPPWMAMPIAIPIEEGLGELPALENVVLAIAEIAATLARLHAESVAHRDVKPTNLYRHGADWVVSDFGLVDIPGGEPLTVGAKALGPRYFIAPEMILRPAIAAGPPADVYSLGKTLWCLVTGQRIPPPGEHRRDLQWKSIREWGVAHPRAFYLDRLIEQTSLEIAGNRPSMAIVARTLTEWAAPRQEAQEQYDLDLKDVTREIADILASDRATIDRNQSRRAEAEELAQRLAVSLNTLIEQLDAVGLPHSGITADSAAFPGPLVGYADAIPGPDRVAAHRSVAVQRNTGRDQRYAFLRSGVAAALATDQTVIVAAAHSIRQQGGDEMVWKDSSQVVLLGSSDLDREIKRIQDGFAVAVPTALNRFLEIIRGE